MVPVVHASREPLTACLRLPRQRRPSSKVYASLILPICSAPISDAPERLPAIVWQRSERRSTGGPPARTRPISVCPEGPPHAPRPHTSVPPYQVTGHHPIARRGSRCGGLGRSAPRGSCGYPSSFRSVQRNAPVTLCVVPDDERIAVRQQYQTKVLGAPMHRHFCRSEWASTWLATIP